MNILNNRHVIVRLALVLAVLALDQGTKYWVLEMLQRTHHSIPIFSWFHLVLVWNKGISFGLFHDHAAIVRIILLVVIIVVIAACGWWAWRIRDAKQGVLWSLIFGAAVGNLTDRIRWGAVMDFIDWSYAGHHWPAFNIADSVLTVCGVILCVQHLFFQANPLKKRG